MFRSLHKIGLATGAALLVSAAGASGALAANPIVISVTGNTLYIDDPTGVTQAESVKTNTAGTWYEIEEINSANELVEGTGAFAAVQYTSRRWIVGSLSGNPITRIYYRGNAGADLVNTTAVTDVPVSLFGGDDGDLLYAGPGNDVLNGGNGNDTVKGGSGNDIITGWAGADSIYGQNGDDQIFDADGYADTVDGGNDYDEFTRDAGLDTATNIELYK